MSPMEEQAWLVRARSDSESSGGRVRGMAYTQDRLTAATADGSGELTHTANAATSPPENGQDNDSGELLDYNDSSVLEQFHEDALRQAGCGLAQARVVLAGSLAVAGATLELSAIPFILPSAEIELCILAHEKNWLLLISLVGGSLGALCGGALGARLGRRRALLSCLAVNAVFAAIAAFMPTYGTFMMARFCSAIGSGGIVPTCYTYAGEVTPRAWRSKALAALLGAAGVGALLAAVLAAAVLPPTGPLTLIENKEHFSAWHRYLLICTLPILMSLASLIWTRESPRYLLDVGREVDAMAVYQSVHTGNQPLICGSNARTAPGLAACELALPGKRRPQGRPQGIRELWQSFSSLFSPAYRRTTLSLGGTLVLTMIVQFYLLTFVPATVTKMDNEIFEASKRTINNDSFTDQHYNRTMENIDYYNVTFSNCTFRDMLMSHVAFRNCTFKQVMLYNIKTSYTSFKGCLFINSSIIDADIEVGLELDPWCVLNGTTIRGMSGGCNRHADLTTRLAPITQEQSYAAHAMLIAAVLALLPQKYRPTVALCAILVLLSPSLYLAQNETALYVVEAVYRLILTLVFFAASVGIVDSFPANLRCTAHGLSLSVGGLGGACVRGAPAAAPALSAAFLAMLCSAAAVAAYRHRTR